MLRLLWIPVAGTVAALIVILVTHEPRPGAPDAVTPPDDFDVEISPFDPIVGPVLDVTLLEDGRCRADFEWDGRTGLVLAPDAMLDRLAPEGSPRHAVRLLASSSAVTETMLQSAAAVLRRRCDVTIETHAGNQED